MSGHIRAVSVGENKAWNRMARLIVTACDDAGCSPNTAAAVARIVADLAREEGLVLTWQVGHGTQPPVGS